MPSHCLPSLAATGSDLHLLTLDNAETWLELPKNLDSCPEVTGRYVELWQPILVLAAWIDKLAAEGATKKGLLRACRRIAPTQSRSTGQRASEPAGRPADGAAVAARWRPGATSDTSGGQEPLECLGETALSEFRFGRRPVMSTQQLAKVSRMTTAVARAKDVSELGDIRDQIVGLQAVLRARGERLDQEHDLATPLTVERKAGALLVGMTPAGKPLANGTLTEFGVSRWHSMVWQAVSAVPEDVFETRRDQQRQQAAELSTKRCTVFAAVAQTGPPEAPAPAPRQP